MNIFIGILHITIIILAFYFLILYISILCGLEEFIKKEIIPNIVSKIFGGVDDQ